MTDRGKKLIRNRTLGFLIFTGQAVRQIGWHSAFRDSNTAVVPVMLERVFSEST